MRRFLLMLLVVALPLGLVGCGEYGKVDQGRVIAYDKNAKTVTLIQDKAMEPLNPDYSILPPHTYKLPVDPAEMGPEPKAGQRMKLDTKANIIRIFNTKTQAFEDIAFKMVDLQENIDRNHPLVYDKATETAKKFPMVDRDKKTVTIYSGRQKMLCTISMPDEYFALPDATWDAGDEVRVYYKAEGVSLRFMNITKTDIFKK
ncbi:DUF4881 domain-containing protein [Nitratidesulfovibrio liaohensis]|uniref:DUF4881 domain-containing protein n=1 Tax=Nitratidesulfovibrio liaohensis TaxID=2604158 RepID=A0ABY9QYV8_9BACT|nr:DUF4881 domain-containing protein [Nitratidesulfovibrio liaohensis]WMW64720.1 DUF4881 domain-containing protein [Nitratidesulfovibrio liaohensis]